MQREVGWGHPDSSECQPQLVVGGYRADTAWVNIATLASLFLLHSMVFSSRRLPSLTDFLSDEAWLWTFLLGLLCQMCFLLLIADAVGTDSCACKE